MADERKDIPGIGNPSALVRIREEMMRYMGKLGNPLDRGVTVRDLTDANIIALRRGFLAGNGGNPIGGPGTAIGGATEPDLTPPPTPTGFELDSAISAVFVLCDNQTYLQGHGHADTVVYGATVNPGDPLPTFSNAVELLSFPGTVASYATDPSLTWRMWIKWRSRDGVLSVDPAGGTNGLEIKTGLDVDRLVAAMTGPGNPFKVVAFETTLPDGTVIPAGTYTADAFIHAAQITTAKIAKLAVENANIANMNVDKLTAGSLNVGAYIQSTNYVGGTSGWRINGAGFAEFSGVTVRGTVYASAGSIGGIVIQGGRIVSSNYNGAVGFALNSDGTLDLPNGSIFASKISASSLAAISANLGLITTGAININQDGGGGWGYVRSPGKWLNDGVHGFIMARHADGSVFWDMTANNMKFYGYNTAPQGGGSAAVIDFAGAFYADSNGYMEVRRANVIDTFNIAGNAVTVPAGAMADDKVQLFVGAPINTSRLIVGGYNSRGAPVIVSISFAGINPGASGSGDSEGTADSVLPLRIKVWRGGGVVASRIATGATIFYITNWPDGPADIWVTFEPPDIGTGFVRSRTVSIMGCRR